LATYRSKGWPVLWTGLTTLAAFGSLVTAGLPPLRSLGLWSALGIAVMTVLAFTFFPTLLAGARWKAAPQPVRPFEIWAQRRGRIWAGWAVRHRFPAVVVMAVLLVVGLLGIIQLRVEDNLAKYFPVHHPVRVELERLQQRGVGVFAAELVLSFEESKSNTGTAAETGFQDPWSQQRLAGLSRRLRSDPLVYGAVSSGELVEAVIRSLLVEGEVNDSIRWMALGLMQMVPESRKLMRALVTGDGQSARVTLLLPMVSFHQVQPLFERIKAEAARFFPTAKIWITGQYPLILLAQRTLLRGLIAALSVTLLCVVIVFLLLLRSVRLTFLVLVPNLWPVVVVLGGMGWLTFPLDSASVMTAAIVLGLAVDDTFHTMGHFLRVVRRSSPAAAIEATMERIAPAHILTSIILIAGFAACSFSDLLPVSRLGVLSAVAIALALVGDLLLIPALLTLYQNPIKQKLLRGVQGGGFLEKSPPGRRRQKKG
jgi:predicted RND superfamily exporter protein